jgi:hypothetical protein
MSIPSPHAPATRPAGIVLFVVTLLTVAFMAHHPTAPHTPDVGHAIERIADLAHASAIVHGALIASMLVTAWCLSVFASRRDLDRPLVRTGAIAYAAGVVVMIGAALVSGFVVSDVATLMPHDTSTDQQVARALLTLCGILNQACANCATVAMSAGILLWSIDLVRRRDRDDRRFGILVGALGIAVGIVPIVALPMGAIRLDVHGMMLVVLLWSAWLLAVAGWLIRVGRAQ